MACKYKLDQSHTHTRDKGESKGHEGKCNWAGTQRNLKFCFLFFLFEDEGIE